MKPTNDRAIIRLIHMPTGHSVDWVISRAVMPSVHYINDRVDTLRDELNSYLEAHHIDLDKQKPAPEHVLQINRMNTEIMRLKMDALSCVLDTKDPLPARFSSKREYLEQCIGSYAVISGIMDFFSKLSISTIALPEGSPNLVQFLKANGEPWELENTTDQIQKVSSTD